jgi:SAM-dependent methyltransferase
MPAPNGMGSSRYTVGSQAGGRRSLEVASLEFDGSDGMGTNEDTVKSYEASAAEYAAEAASMPGWVAGEIEAFVDALGGTGRILEVGSGGGRDARVLERRGLSVRCTDVAQGFVDLLRAAGFDADRLDPLNDDLADPQNPDAPYDGVWSCDCFPRRSRRPRHRSRSARPGDQVGWSNPRVVQRGRRRGSVQLRHSRCAPALHRNAVAGA